MLSDSTAFLAFQSFLKRHSAGLRSIAYKAGPETSSDDVGQDAWLIAVEIGNKRGHPVDFSNPDDQSTVMAWLTNRLLKYVSKKLKNALRIDAEQDDDFSISRTLAGSDNDNPLNQLMRHVQEVAEVERIPPLVRQSYSQASAYALLLTKFDGKKSAVAKLLGMTLETFRRKFQQANAWVSIQPSLFDGLIHVALDFLPKPKVAKHSAGRSFELNKEALVEQIPLDFKFSPMG